jgi:hypothetical protein
MKYTEHSISMLYIVGYKLPQRLCGFQNLKWSEL